MPIDEHYKINRNNASWKRIETLNHLIISKESDLENLSFH